MTRRNKEGTMTLRKYLLDAAKQGKPLVLYLNTEPLLASIYLIQMAVIITRVNCSTVDVIWKGGYYSYVYQKAIRFIGFPGYLRVDRFSEFRAYRIGQIKRSHLPW